MGWYGILWISQMIGDVDGLLAFPSVCDALHRSVHYLYLNVGLP